ncbi:MAG: hypothetical protein K6C97_06085 [Treponema sp.]|nr:hypothetical protein [Treponema sp.]
MKIDFEGARLYVRPICGYGKNTTFDTLFYDSLSAKIMMCSKAFAEKEMLRLEICDNW